MIDTGTGAVRLLHDGEQVATSQTAIARAARLLMDGEVVAIPTDTVYGLAAALTSDVVLGDIFRIKGRARTQTLPVLVSDQAAAGQVLRRDDGDRDGVVDAEGLLALAERFWPGGLTVALPARTGLPADVVAADGTVGVRVPDDAVVRALLRLTGGALAVTSANRSGVAPLTEAGDVTRELGPAGLRWVLDGGPSGLAVASTVIGQANGDLVIHRQGAITEFELRRVWAELRDVPDSPAR